LRREEEEKEEKKKSLHGKLLALPSDARRFPVEYNRRCPRW
jgi:hypothetical protein